MGTKHAKNFVFWGDSRSDGRMVKGHCALQAFVGYVVDQPTTLSLSKGVELVELCCIYIWDLSSASLQGQIITIVFT